MGKAPCAYPKILVLTCASNHATTLSLEPSSSSMVSPLSAGSAMPPAVLASMIAPGPSAARSPAVNNGLRQPILGGLFRPAYLLPWRTGRS